MKDVRAHVVVVGFVQGVGFRYFVSRLARSYGLSGWVKNLPAGEVEIEVEGPRGLIEDFLDDLKVKHPYARVRGLEVEWHPFSGRYTSFEIRY